MIQVKKTGVRISPPTAVRVFEPPQFRNTKVGFRTRRRSAAWVAAQRAEIAQAAKDFIAAMKF